LQAYKKLDIIFKIGIPYTNNSLLFLSSV